MGEIDRKHHDHRLRTLAAGALALCVCAGGALLLAATVAPKSGVASAAASVLPLPSVHAARAQAALAKAPADLASARIENAAALRAAPRQAELHLQRAYILALTDGKLDDGARASLATAYDLAPLDHRLARWRIPFALNQWNDIGAVNRRHVLVETEVLWNSIEERRWLRGVAQGVGNPSGHLAIQLQVERLESQSRTARGDVRS